MSKFLHCSLNLSQTATKALRHKEITKKNFVKLRALAASWLKRKFVVRPNLQVNADYRFLLYFYSSIAIATNELIFVLHKSNHFYSYEKIR